MTPQELINVWQANINVYRCTARGVTKNKQDAEDTLQESYKRALEHCEECQINAASWLGTIVRNEALTVLRQRHRKFYNDHDMPDKELTDMTVEKEFKDSTDLSLHFEQKNVVEAILNMIPEKHRHVLYLWYYEGLNEHEMCAKLGYKKLSSVRVRKWRALALARDAWAAMSRPKFRKAGMA